MISQDKVKKFNQARTVESVCIFDLVDGYGGYTENFYCDIWKKEIEGKIQYFITVVDARNKENNGIFIISKNEYERLKQVEYTGLPARDFDNIYKKYKRWEG